jgi:hypothetical protein
MNRVLLNQAEPQAEVRDERTGFALPFRTTPDRCSFLTILKLREMKRRKRRSPDAE